MAGELCAVGNKRCNDSSYTEIRSLNIKENKTVQTSVAFVGTFFNELTKESGRISESTREKAAQRIARMRDKKELLGTTPRVQEVTDESNESKLTLKDSNESRMEENLSKPANTPVTTLRPDIEINFPMDSSNLKETTTNAKTNSNCLATSVALTALGFVVTALTLASAYTLKI